MNINVNLILFSIVLNTSLLINAQKTYDVELVSNIQELNVQERVLMILNQDLYLAGETIHFMANTFDAGLQIPIDFSSVLYIELYDQGNNVICQKKLQLHKGEVVNYVLIPRQTPTGYYFIRAYTNYMKNYGAGSFYTKRIRIVNPFILDTQTYNDTLIDSPFKLLVKTEGSLIANMENKICFYNSTFGKNTLVYLYENDSIIKKIEAKYGFGTCSFTPNESKYYYMKAYSEGEKRDSVALNNIYNKGILCKLDSTAENIAYFNIINNTIKPANLSFQVENNGLIYTTNITLSKKNNPIQLKLPIGYNHVNIKQNETIIANRSVFIDSYQEFNITAKPNPMQASAKDNLELNLKSNITDSIKYLVNINLANNYTLYPFHTVLRWLLLTPISISNTNITFNEISYLSNNKDLINDYILKFQHRQSKASKIYLPEIGKDIISGSITTNRKTCINKSQNLFISFVDSISWVNQCNADSLGIFACSLPLKNQSDNLIITVNDTSNHYQILLDNEFFPEFLPIIKENYYPKPYLKDLIESRMINLQIDDIFNDSNLIDFKNRNDLRFYGYPTKQYSFNDYIKLPTFAEFIFEIVDEAITSKSKNNVEFSLLPKYILSKERPFILLDGVPIFNTNTLAVIPCNKLDSIKILSDMFYWGNNVYGGIFDISSKSKKFDLIDIPKNSVKLNFCPINQSVTHLIDRDKRRTPKYLSNIYFNVFCSKMNDTLINIPIPDNKGSFILNIIGFTNDGKWNYLKQENIKYFK